MIARRERFIINAEDNVAAHDANESSIDVTTVLAAVFAMDKEMSGVDEWETAEVQLRHVSLESTSMKAPVIIAPTLDQSYVPVVPSRDVPIDDALLTACENPREKMVVYQLEDSILKFVESPNEHILDLPSGLNSFRRLVAHRLADRFCLLKEQITTEGNDKTIRLIKSSATCIPRPLIIDYRGSSSPVVTISAKNPSISSSNSINTSDNDKSMDNQNPETPTSEPKKVVMLMKRKPVDNNSSSSKSSTNKPQLTAEDRERAYQEARARIFGESNADGNNNATEVIPSSSSPASAATNEQGSNLKFIYNMVDTSETSQTSGEINQLKRSTSGGQLTSSNSTNNLTLMSSSGKVRAQLRSTETERNDPDFVRRGRVPGNTSGQNSPYFRNTGNSGKYPNNGNYYASNNVGYSEPSSFAGLNPKANTWQQSFGPPITNSTNYYNNNTYTGNTAYVPPPPSLVTPSNPGYDSSAVGYYHSQFPTFQPQQQQQYGYYSQNPQGYEAGVYYGAAANINSPPAPVMTTPNITNSNAGKRSPPNASQADFPQLR